MKRKSWFVPIIVFFICIGFLLVYQQNQFTTSHATPSDMPPILWSTTPDDIVRIVVKEKGKTIEAVKGKLEWQLVSDTYTDANNFYILTILSNFKKPNLLSVVTSDNTTLDKYGIDKFSKSIMLYDKSGNQYELICGNEATSNSYYVYSPFSGSVYTIAKSVFDIVTAHPLDWRDLNYLYFDKNNTSKITVDYEGKVHTITSSIESGNTTFSSVTLTQATVDDFILFLEGTRIKGFITDHATDTVLSSYGFDRPVLKMTITTKDNKATTISIGSMLVEENLGYVTLNNSKAIFAVPYFNLIPKTTPEVLDQSK